jgi:hypothetical protein
MVNYAKRPSVCVRQEPEARAGELLEIGDTRDGGDSALLFDELGG